MLKFVGRKNCRIASPSDRIRKVKRIYLLTRDLHLYAGLFISPFLLIFAVSVFCLAHGWLPAPEHPAPRTFSGLKVPSGIQQAKGKEQLALLRPLLDQMDVHGEINFVRNVASENRLIVPVSVPGRETEVSLHLPSGTAVITERANSFLNSIVYLHKMPGPHNVAYAATGFTRASGDGLLTLRRMRLSSLRQAESISGSRSGPNGASVSHC